MIAIPAIDIRDGACVQLVGGSYDAERVRIEDPVGVAREWVRVGFRRLHVVDLDAATGVGDNDSVIERIRRQVPVELQVGGGIRSTERARALLDSGASAVVVGTRAIEDGEWLSALALTYPRRVIVAADVRGREILTHGWTRAAGRDIEDFVAAIDTLPLAGLLVTAVHVEGRMTGPDLELISAITRERRLPIIASGGIGSLTDLDALASCGASAAVIGMALYTGAIDPSATATHYST